MASLGSIGSRDFTEQAQSAQTATMGTENDPVAMALKQVFTLFQSQYSSDHAIAMKNLIALMSKGHDVSEYSPLVVQLVASHDPLCRQLAYVYLSQYAEDSPDAAILSVNTFQRSLTDSDPMVRAQALKVMSSIRNPDILTPIYDAVCQVIGDTSPYVKKAAAFAMIKVAELEPTEIEKYLPLLQRIIGDPSPIAFSGAIAAYWVMCPHNYEILHPYFRQICQQLPKLDEWAQVFCLRALTIYARYCFKDPSGEDDEEVTAFWDESATDRLNADLLLLIHGAKCLLSSPNSAVVMAAVSLLFYCAPSSHMSSVARPLVRLLYEGTITAEISLSTILTICQVYPHIFVPHLNHFFIKRGDNSTIKKLKLKIIALLASPTNAAIILDELSIYTGSNDLMFAAEAVQTMTKATAANEAVVPFCLVSLLRLMNTAEGEVLSEVVVAIASLLRLKRGTDDEDHALRQLCKKFTIVKDPKARASILSIVGDLHETHPEYAPLLLRVVGKSFTEEPGEVRIQALTLAARLIAFGADQKVPSYVLQIGARDLEYDVKDRARFLTCLLGSKSESLQPSMRELICPERESTLMAPSIEVEEFQMGTLSHFFKKAVPGYDPIPDWAPESELPEDSVRNPVGIGAATTIGHDFDEANILGLKDFFGDDEEEDEYSGYGDYYSDEGYYSDENEEQRLDNFFDE